LELARNLFQAGGKVYIAGRSETKAQQAIEDMKASTADSSVAGEIQFLQLELDDLSTIRAAVEEFKSKESRLYTCRMDKFYRR
jgi:saccharopine dehydrogenase-like NADP-dependent oxidoreductase